ncbi:alpha/beta fold hydrolase [Nocardia thailandica]
MRRTSGRRTAVDGVDNYVEMTGSGPTPVVFESGGGAGRTLWDRAVPLLGDDVRAVAYDRAGRGRSGTADAPQRIEDMAATLVALTRNLALERPILVGHSMGGLIVRRAAEACGPPGSSWSIPCPNRPRCTTIGHRRPGAPTVCSPRSRR